MAELGFTSQHPSPKNMSALSELKGENQISTGSPSPSPTDTIAALPNFTPTPVAFLRNKRRFPVDRRHGPASQCCTSDFPGWCLGRDRTASGPLGGLRPKCDLDDPTAQLPLTSLWEWHDPCGWVTGRHTIWGSYRQRSPGYCAQGAESAQTVEGAEVRSGCCWA